ncbi:hypothetical protein NDU88_005363 [Pleurodeles waltl]|uniref:Uncharacterized protein n=1 Tax=Pleurodeles waltl TaxID=8319 RepID=A0AAV7TBR0_PLEWA|nr:hypothetical protein NDU88_005363 [Pleurodeles waltl]
MSSSLAGAVFEELQVKPDPTWSFDVRNAIVGSSAESCVRFTDLSCFRRFYTACTKRSWACGTLCNVANCITLVAPAQPAPLLCLLTGGRSQPSTGGASPCVRILAAAGVPTTIPLEAQAQAATVQQAPLASTALAKSGPDGELEGSAGARQCPATAPSRAKRAPPAPESPGGPQPGRPRSLAGQARLAGPVQSPLAARTIAGGTRKAPNQRQLALTPRSKFAAQAPAAPASVMSISSGRRYFPTMFVGSLHA